jgi:hypothetical protein
MPVLKGLHRNIERVGWMVTISTFVFGAGYLLQQQDKHHQELIKELINGVQIHDRSTNRIIPQNQPDIDVSFTVLPPNDSKLGAAFWVAGHYDVMNTEITTDDFYRLRFGKEGDMHPYLFSSKDELFWFADALSVNHGLSPCYQKRDVAKKHCSGWRVPKSNEWMLFANAGQGTLYSGSDVFSDVGWGVHENYFVGTKPPNQWGLYDMSGGAPEIVHEKPTGAYGVLGGTSILQSMRMQSLPSSFAARLLRVSQVQKIR